MPRIHLLSDHLVSQIAAGEVVERPASVVKELVENALDAGASEVRVELEAGGKRRIVVADDGSGMGRDDALLAFDRHATSKIASFEDLQRVGTLGFRGEALASIAAVARVEVMTAEAAGEGQRVRIEGGRVKVAEPAARARGTTVEVASLFFNVPARRKFLKQPATELRRALEVVQGYALARPEVRFTVVHDGRTLLDALPAAGEGRAAVEGARERIAQIFDRAFADLLVAIPADRPGVALAGETIGGLVGTPATARGRRQFVFVNRRLLRDRTVLSTFLPGGAGRLEVRRLPGALPVPRRAARGGGRQRPPAEGRGPLPRPAPLRPPLRSPAPRPASGPRRGAGPPAHSRGPAGDAAGLAGAGRPAAVGTVAAGAGTAPKAPGRCGRRRRRAVLASTAPAPPARLAEVSWTPLQRPAVPLSGRSGPAQPFRLLGQYKGTLILLEGPDGLYLIDQHVAHERLLFERLRRAMASETTPSQTLLTPPILELSAAEHLLLTELAPALETCGFGLAPLSGSSLALTAVPAPLSADEAEELLRGLAAGGADDSEDGGAEGLRLRILETLAASMACKAAVKMHHPLAAAEMEALVGELFQAEDPYACPHGRPIVLKMSDTDLERRFGRR